MYLPSYVSLHTALAFYGLIPEAIVQYTSVSSLKTNNFKNQFGTFTYNNIKAECFFGYNILPFSKEKSILIAKAEKALLDMLYFYPFYDSEKELKDLRIDESVLNEVINRDTFIEFGEKYNNKMLLSRMNTFIKVYRP